MTFFDQLRRHSSEPTPRQWLYVPYDQLTDQLGPLSRLQPGAVGIVLVESSAKASRRPYHKQKLALILANQRHFALEQAARGVRVDYRVSEAPYAGVLRRAAQEHGPLTMMEAAERELRNELQPLLQEGLLKVVPHEGWLSTETDFNAIGPAPWRMDAFYRGVRRRTGLLMTEGKPEGARFSHDGDNRKPWRGEPLAPEPPRFTPTDITLEVGALIEHTFAHHPGVLDLTSLPATHEDAEHLWAWAMQHCIENFGPFEDAMSTQSKGLFHTRVAPLLNLHRLLPARVVADVAQSDAPLSSREGFVRQVLGWREFVRHVHRHTDGMRSVDGTPLTDPLSRDRALPAAFWQSAPSGLHCLDEAVSDVWQTGWTHHIVRLMVLSNLATLLDVRPQELSDWFWVGFIDAFDWVVEPNVVGMGTFGVGDAMTTKPYVSGANYLHKMSDACASCAFHPKKTCPITPMYWAFLDRHHEALSTVDRMALPLGASRRRDPAKKAHDRAIFEWVSAALAAGQRVEPRDLPAAP